MVAKHPAKNVELMASATVAIVAFAGLILVYSDLNFAPTGAFGTSKASWDMSLRLGEVCGQCGLLASKNMELPEECSRISESQGRIFRPDDYRGSYNCCRRACMSPEIFGLTGATSFEYCNSICIKAASDVFSGKARYSGNPFRIPRSS